MSVLLILLQIGIAVFCGPPAAGSCAQSRAFFARAGFMSADKHNVYDTMICVNVY